MTRFAGFPIQRRLEPPTSWPLTLVVVIDTEEEFDWSAPFDPNSTAVENIAQQELAQRIFRAHGVVPTYVIDYPVADTAASVAVLRPWLEAGEAEIGAHLHPWVTPPVVEEISTRHSYPGNLPPELERRKLVTLTERITETFGRRPVVYKAGRYGLGPATAGTLAELGYEVDASVVPYTSFTGDGGPDFSEFPNTPFLAPPRLVELPLSVHFVGRLARLGDRLFPHIASPAGLQLRLPAIAARLGLLERLRLSPEGHSAEDMIRQTRAAVATGARLLMLTYHSSTLLPGATRYARDAAERDAFLTTLDRYLEVFHRELGGRSLTVTQVANALRSRAGTVAA
jgi:hypothetical protein